MTPSIAFIIFRMNSYRVMAPAIDAALRRGWRVECWHDVGTFMPKRPLDFPTVARAPAFRNGSAVFREYRGYTELVSLLQQKPVDAVVNLIPPLGARKESWPDLLHRPLYVLLESSPADWFYHVADPEELGAVDLFALTTQSWLEQDLQLMKESSRFPFTTEMEAEFRRKAIPVGWPQIDQLSLIDPNTVRSRWGIPGGQPVVVYLDWTDASHLSLRLAMFMAPPPLKMAKALVRHHKEWQSLPRLLRERNIRHVTKALRAFCDRNHAYLIVKHRHRERVLPCERQMADRVIADETYYPHTICEVMSIADLSIGYFSWGVRESVAARVPHLVFDVAGLADQPSAREKAPAFARRCSAPGGFMNYAGVVRVMDMEEIVGKLPQMSLSDFRLDERAWAEYYSKYLGIPGVANSDVFLDEVQRLIDGKTSGATR